MGAQDIVSRLQWVDEKLMRPFQELLKAMQEVAEVEAQFVGKQQAVISLETQVKDLQSKINAKRDELRTLETADTARVQTKILQLEQDHAARLASLDKEYEQHSAAIRIQIATDQRAHDDLKARLASIKTEYHGVHQTLQTQHDREVHAREAEIAELDKQLVAVKTKHANFLKEVGHVVR